MGEGGCANENSGFNARGEGVVEGERGRGGGVRASKGVPPQNMWMIAIIAIRSLLLTR